MAWDPASDDATDHSQLIYKVYISESEDDIVSESNLVYQGTGSEELSFTISDAKPGTEYFAAIVAIDGSLNQSAPRISSTITPDETPTIRDDITVYFTDEEGWDVPDKDETGLFHYSIPAGSTRPVVENYIAFTSSEHDGAYILTAVTAVIEDADHYTVEARPAVIMEISDEVSFGGTVRINPGRIRLTTPEAEELAKKKAHYPC
ncbi:MAG: hypothetical protein SV765_14480 [Pseudomonadota bacterium]|nr:hypothetical protein [Pseudomonadota bacterium]